ncbi:Endocuticle structural glycoprotein SgAbd-2 [Pseudolycoriella hygida]|uniref:Endocuticle structural glycoprotein SgAbd-2 n=1 Tax=Pseudolycoriella hygida TaxID=35572 RepID=A0A9Q0N0R3_9DIPT|nr:Endocuticle structural glycoprotein SgAbd-2 [Pseudolycoriella hygida]
MKFIILLSVTLLAVANAAEDVVILRNEQSVNADGSYQYAYETSDGVAVEEQGHLKNAGTDDEAIDVQGQFSYKNEDGSPVNLIYVANENGFQPQGDHLPVPPPIPELIQRALKYLAEHPQTE